MKIKDIYLFSDVDGTLYSMSTGIIERNYKAVQRFKELGGNFALATGRGVEKARAIAEEIGVNIPCILNNGGTIYDFGKNEHIMASYLPDTAISYCEHLLNQFPEIQRTAIICKDNAYTLALGSDGKLQIISSDGADLDIKDVIKEAFRFVFVVPPQSCSTILKYANALELPDVDFCSSDIFYIDIIAKNVSKGSAIEKFCKLKGIDIKQTAAIGDYYNDLNMLKTAGITACVNNAPNDIKSVCSFISCDFTDGAVAQFIEHIEKICD